ncbi:MAG TPA: hypothetical protein DD706_22500 [Nitrospiraceae bacterium]|nr:hypothetical protein [Nitrospiraceae bacterium]
MLKRQSCQSSPFSMLILSMVFLLGCMHSEVYAQTISLSPDPLNLLTNSSGEMSVTLDAPAAPGGVLVNLTLVGASFVTAPFSIIIPEGVSTQNFSINAGASPETVDIFANTTGFVGDSATINVTDGTPENNCKMEATTVKKAAETYAKTAKKLRRLCKNQDFTCETVLAQATSELDQLNSSHANLLLACSP